MSNPKLKSQILAKVAGLLDKFSDRLVATARETRQNSDAIAALRDELRLKTGKVEGQIIDLTHAVVKRNVDLTDAVSKAVESQVRIQQDSEKYDGQQALRDQNNVQALTNLRDSTAKAFTQVRADVEELMKRIQRLNERAGQVESQNAILATTRTKGANEIDQKTVNLKLEGFYDVTEDLDERIAKVERLLELYENLRKAQNELAIANGAFLAGPQS